MQIASRVVERSGTVAELEEAALRFGAIPQYNPTTGEIELHPLRKPGQWPIAVVVKEAA